MSKDKLKGGKADNVSSDKLKKDYGVTDKELEKGAKDEMEHTDDKETGEEIARDHLVSNPTYYSDMEKAGIEETDMPLIRRTILTKLQEHASLKIADETPETTAYFVFDGDRPIGGIMIKNVSGSPNDDTTSIVDIIIAPKEKPLKVIRDAMPLLFNTVPSLNTLTLPTNPKNRAFWERAGANRIKDGLHAFQRGH